MPFPWKILFGYCLDVLLYGILTVQTYIYYLSFPNDRRTTKATVAFIYAVGTMQTAFALHDFYSLFGILCIPDCSVECIKLEGNIRQFGFMWITIPLSGASIAAVSQISYAYRIYALSGKKLIPGVVIGLALLQLSIGILSAFASFGPDQQLILTIGSGRWLEIIGWESSGAICDFVITIYMFRFLSKHIKHSFRPMRVPLMRIKRLTLESGLITTAVATAYVVLPFMSGGDIFMIPGLALSKGYGNSMLALLNGRLRIPGGRNDIDSDCVINHLTITERQTDLQRDESGPSVSA